jgi:RNA ligase
MTYILLGYLRGEYIMENITKIIINNSWEHPAKTMDFSDLEKGLLKEVEDGNVNITYHPEFSNLAIFKYSQNCVCEKNWNVFSLMSRGLILDLENRRVLAVPFLKFFNYNELIDPNDVMTASYVVSNKYDGSLIILFEYDHKWITATCGSFISEQAIWAKEWIDKYQSESKFCSGNTYLFEAIYPENKIVVDYDFMGLVLLSIYDPYGIEYSRDVLCKEAEDLGLQVSKVYNFDDMDSLLSNAKTLDKNNEGYVIRFNNGVRLKVKGDEYVRVHRLISKVTPLAIWEMMLNNDDLEDVKKELPEEMEKDFDIIVSVISGHLKTFIEEVEYVHSKTCHMTDKELGIYFQKNKNCFSELKFPTSKKYVFSMRRNIFYNDVNSVESFARRKVFNAFRPKGNKLDGYIPSSVINRFVENV